MFAAWACLSGAVEGIGTTREDYDAAGLPASLGTCGFS
jgi:hypothetical protein